MEISCNCRIILRMVNSFGHRVLLYIWFCLIIVFVAFDNDWNEVASITTMVNVTLGSYILLPCDPPMANPAPVVEWTIDSSLIDTSTTDKYKVLPSGDLIVGSVVMGDINDGGNPRVYRCRVINRLIFESIDSSFSYQLTEVGKLHNVFVVVDMFTSCCFIV